MVIAAMVMATADMAMARATGTATMVMTGRNSLGEFSTAAADT